MLCSCQMSDQMSVSVMGLSAPPSQALRKLPQLAVVGRGISSPQNLVCWGNCYLSPSTSAPTNPLGPVKPHECLPPLHNLLAIVSPALVVSFPSSIALNSFLWVFALAALLPSSLHASQSFFLPTPCGLPPHSSGLLILYFCGPYYCLVVICA